MPFLQKFANKNSFHSFACKRKTLKNERNYSCFDKIYFEMTDLEKKEFFRNFIDEIELYSERQSDGRIVKQINFNFPVYYNGNEGNAIRLPDENTVETMVLLQRRDI